MVTFTRDELEILGIKSIGPLAFVGPITGTDTRDYYFVAFTTRTELKTTHLTATGVQDADSTTGVSLICTDNTGGKWKLHFSGHRQPLKLNFVHGDHTYTSSNHMTCQ